MSMELGKSIYEVMAYKADITKKYKVVESKNSQLGLGDIISYSKSFSYDGDIDFIEIINHSLNEKILLNYTGLNTMIVGF